MTREKNNLIIAIDGPAGAGKSTIARMVAERLGILYIDTGAMYRAVTFLALDKNLSFTEDMDKIEKLTANSTIELISRDGKYLVFINDRDVTEEIRTPEVTKKISHVAANPEIRKIMVQKQQELGRKGGVILEGRDIQTVVFPDADFKIFLDAKPEERAKRRVIDYETKGKDADFNEVLENIKQRDHNDISRESGPLKMADDAFYLDSTDLNIEQVVQKILEIVKQYGVS